MDQVVSSRFATRVANWRAGVFASFVIAIGLTLNLTVLGANPVVKLAPSAPPEMEQTSPAVASPPPVSAAPVDVQIPPVSDDSVVEPALPEALSAPAPVVAALDVRPAGPQVGPSPAVLAVPAPGPSGVSAPVVTVASTTSPPAPVVVPTTAVPPPTTAAPATVTSTTTPPTVPPTTAPPTTAAPAPIEYLTYTVSGGVGDVVLARQGNAITLYGFYPNSGWVREVESNGPRTVKLKFFNVQTEQDREWKATLEGGRIQVEN